MAKVLKNQTGSIITISDLGLGIPASPAVFTVNPNEYPLFASSTDINTYINNGNIIVNDGYDDLKPQAALLHIHEESIPRQSAFNSTATVQATANSTLTLTSTSRLLYIFTGTVSGQIVKLPSASTLNIGSRYEIWNTSNQSVALQNNGSTALFTLAASQKTWITLQDNSTANGTWLFEANFLGGTGGGNGTLGFGFDGNASTGRWLESLTNVASNYTPIVIAGSKAIRAISFATQTVPTSITVTIYKNGTTLDTITLSGGIKKNTKLNLSHMLNDKDELTAQITQLSGSTSRPVVLLWL